ncbi:Tubulin polyglutamylase ttll5 [Balamuthia mandrillaris]
MNEEENKRLTEVAEAVEEPEEERDLRGEPPTLRPPREEEEAEESTIVENGTLAMGHRVSSGQKQRFFRVRRGFAKDECMFVRQVFQSAGWRETNTEGPWWHLTWAARYTPADYAGMKPYQKVNVLPAMPEICRKDLLHKNIQRRRQQLGEEAFAFWPKGFLLEEEEQFQEFQQLFLPDNIAKNSGDKPVYIIKLPLTANGKGVHLVTCAEEVAALKGEDSVCYPLEKKHPLAQEYIKDVMLVDGFKVTLRVYVAITSFDPLRIYVYPNGLVRMCSQRYSLDSFEDACAHIDSFELNQHYEAEFQQRVSPSLRHDGLRCDIKYFMEVMKEEQGMDTDKLWRDIKYAVAMCVVSAEDVMSNWVCKLVKHRANAFEILGYDVLVSNSGEVFILEVNHTPSLCPHTALENEIKVNMLTELYTLVGCFQPEVCPATTSRIVGDKWAALERRKERQEEMIIRGFDLSRIQTKQDLWVIVDSELEVFQLLSLLSLSSRSLSLLLALFSFSLH